MLWERSGYQCSLFEESLQIAGAPFVLIFICTLTFVLDSTAQLDSSSLEQTEPSAMGEQKEDFSTIPFTRVQV